MEDFSEFLVEVVAKEVGIITPDGGIPDVNAPELAMERLDELIDNLKNMGSKIADTKDRLEDYVATYKKLIEDIPEIDKEEIPSDLLESYKQVVNEVKEMGIPEKIRRGEELTLEEQLAWQELKEVRSTIEFVKPNPKKPDISEQLSTFRNMYKRLITNSQGKIRNLGYIEDRMKWFIDYATGVQNLLQTLSKIPQDVLNLGGLMKSLNEASSSMSQVINYCTTKAFNFNKTPDSAEVTGMFDLVDRARTNVIGATKEQIKEAEEKGIDPKLIAELKEDEAILEEIGRGGMMA